MLTSLCFHILNFLLAHRVSGIVQIEHIAPKCITCTSLHRNTIFLKIVLNICQHIYQNVYLGMKDEMIVHSTRFIQIQTWNFSFSLSPSNELSRFQHFHGIPPFLKAFQFVEIHVNRLRNGYLKRWGGGICNAEQFFL